MRNRQPPKHAGTDGFAHHTGNRANHKSAQQRMGIAVQDGLVLQDACQRLNVHQDLGTPKHHETETVTAECLERQAGSEV